MIKEGDGSLGVTEQFHMICPHKQKNKLIELESLLGIRVGRNGLIKGWYLLTIVLGEEEIG